MKSFANCVICDKELKYDPDCPLNVNSNIIDGICCGSRGNWGSTVFDSMCDREGNLRFVICDQCVMAKADKFNHVWLRGENIHCHTFDHSLKQWKVRAYYEYLEEVKDV